MGIPRLLRRLILIQEAQSSLTSNMLMLMVCKLKMSDNPPYNLKLYVKVVYCKKFWCFFLDQPSTSGFSAASNSNLLEIIDYSDDSDEDPTYTPCPEEMSIYGNTVKMNRTVTRQRGNIDQGNTTENVSEDEMEYETEHEAERETHNEIEHETEHETENEIEHETEHEAEHETEDENQQPKKRMRRTEMWEVTKRSAATRAGLEHKSKSGKNIKAKALKPGCAPCKKNCTLKVNEPTRQQIFSTYWDEKKSWDLKRQFVRSHVTTKPIQRYRPKNSSKNQRKHSILYSLDVKTGDSIEKIEVCNIFFFEYVGHIRNCSSQRSKKGR